MSAKAAAKGPEEEAAIGIGEPDQSEELRSVRTALLQAAESLCHDFASAASTDALLTHFLSASAETDESKFIAAQPIAHEHGHPTKLAPFLGRPFTGRDGIAEYFNLLQRHLAFEKMEFGDYLVDELEQAVCVRGRARFTCKETGRGWDECFTYRLKFWSESQDGESAWKVGRYEVWADTGSLYLASLGEDPDKV